MTDMHPSNEYVVRPATLADRPAVEELLRTAGLPLDGLDEQFGEQYAVADSAGRVVGAEGVERYGESGLLRSAVVDARWRGRGVGDRLTSDRLAWARRSGLREVWLLTTTAAAYFPRFGFAVADRAAASPAMQESREFASACPASATAMRLVLDANPDASGETR